MIVPHSPQLRFMQPVSHPLSSPVALRQPEMVGRFGAH